ncbi:unnamed protein product [Echinostoma caproni]|uniref:UTP--glucose-1-phosphate uridylyltransferase n=1 Tax=Echinostoma caproni TaxID=27848 RepID=A0A183AWQ1_9TREM|nr:unnamed protein product [Echinostoma caproni]
MTGIPSRSSFRALASKSSFREVPFSDGENNIRSALNELQLEMSDEERETYPIDEDTFMRMYRAYLKKTDQFLNWGDITQPEELIKQYDTLVQPSHSEAVKLLNKLVVIKLNGGLGTSMGCSGPKSLIPVRDGKNFIDLTVEQISVSQFI